MRTIDPPEGFSTLIEWHKRMKAPEIWSKLGVSVGSATSIQEHAAIEEFTRFRRYFEYRPDPKGKDIWQRCRLVKIDGKWKLVGDCEDGELDLQIWFVSVGIPRGALRLAVSKRSGEGHCVTILRCESVPDLVFDLLDPEPHNVGSYPHPIIARQLIGTDDKWQDLRPEPTLQKVTAEARITHLEKMNNGLFESIHAMHGRLDELEKVVQHVEVTDRIVGAGIGEGLGLDPIAPLKA